MESTMRPTRREFLQLSAAVTLAGTAGLSLLEACGGGPGAPSAAGHANLPAYVPFKGPKPDFPGNAAGVEDAYASFPTQLVRSVQQPPLRGGQVTVLAPLYTQPPTPMSQNAFWQALNQALGGTLNMQLTASGDYQTKLNTVVAGGQLPDIMQVRGAVTAGSDRFPHFPEFLQSQCVDLTPYLSGDAVKQYPNLANIHPFAWRSCVINGKLWGLPVPRAVQSSSMLFVHQELLDAAGMSQPRTADDLLRLATALTRPQQGRWAIAAHIQQPGFGMNLWQQVFRGVNAWHLDSSGKLTRDLETDAYKQALAYVRQLYQAGIFHPDSISLSTNAAKTLFDGAKVAMVIDSWSAYAGYVNRSLVSDPGSKVRVMLTFGHDGGKPNYFFGAGNFGMAVLKKADSSRVKELLQLANHMAAPFGTVEKDLLDNGVRGVDYQPDARGNPVKNARGLAEVLLPLSYITAAPTILYNAQEPNYGSFAHAAEVALTPLGIPDPTIGLYSPTDSTTGPTLDQMIRDRLNDFVTGRQPLSALSTLVHDWRTQGGDQIRSEYEKALQSK